MPDKAQPDRPSKAAEAAGSCQYCGAPTRERIAGDYVCLQCYVERSSCCQEQD